MRTIICILILLVTASVSHAEDIEFYEDGILDSGNYFYGDTYNNAIVDMTGGYVDWMRTHNFSTLNVSGGELGTIIMLDSSTVNLYGGDISTITVDDLSNLNVYGYGFDYIGSGSTGSLIGFWADSSEFSILLRNTTYPSSQVVLHEIPEPVSFCLFAASFIGVRLIRNKR